MTTRENHPMRVPSNEESFLENKSRDNYFRDKYHTEPKKSNYKSMESDQDDDI